MKPTVVFFGTPRFAAEVLRYLLRQGVSIKAVVTQPDRPKGRSLQLTASEVKTVVQEEAPSIPLFQPDKASQESFLEQLSAFKADLFVVVAYGQILSQKLLDIPPCGCINVHASLLPKYRGAAPIQRCLMAGDSETGIAIQKMVRQLDAGDVIAESKIEISSDATFGELEEKLCELAKPLLLSVIHSFKEEIPVAKPQNPELATYAAKIELEEGQIDWSRPGHEIHNLVRAFSPRPGAWCWVLQGEEKKRLKILRTRYVSSQGNFRHILSLTPHLIVACGEGAVELLEVQPEGKKVMQAPEWIRGQKKVEFL